MNNTLITNKNKIIIFLEEIGFTTDPTGENCFIKTIDNKRSVGFLFKITYNVIEIFTCEEICLICLSVKQKDSYRYENITVEDIVINYTEKFIEYLLSHPGEILEIVSADENVLILSNGKSEIKFIK